MKGKMMLFGVVLILGLLALGCGNPAGGGEDPNAYNGTTWDRTGYTLPNYERIIFTSNSAWKQVSGDGQSETQDASGSYTVSGDDVTLATDYTGLVTGGNTMTFPGPQVYLKRGPLVGTWKMGEVTLTFHDAYHYTVMVDADTGTRGEYTATATTFTLTPDEMITDADPDWVTATGPAATPSNGTISSAAKITITGYGDFTKQ